MRALLPGVAALVAFMNPAFAAEDTVQNHFRVYRGDGTPSSLEEVVASARNADAVFLGEVHDDPTAHQLELDFLKRLLSPQVALGLEMFERDVQSVVDEYLAGFISEDAFTASARTWKNYKTDYRPLLELARENKLAVVASNAPRRYVNRVSRLGSDSLSALPEYTRKWLAPLPVLPPSAAYAKRFHEEMWEHVPTPPEKKDKSTSDVKPPKFDEQRALDAQALWDATMAFSIADYLTRHPRSKVLHVNGGFHSAQRLGIVEDLSLYRPGARSLVTTMLPAKAPFKFDSKDMRDEGDFVIVTDVSLIREAELPASKPPLKK